MAKANKQKKSKFKNVTLTQMKEAAQLYNTVYKANQEAHNYYHEIKRTYEKEQGLELTPTAWD